jgi:hypothetical protein
VLRNSGAANGDGAIVRPLRAAHFDVAASDLVDYGGAGIMAGVDYLAAPLPAGVTGIVTNPPYKLAERFARQVLDEVPICRCYCGRIFSKAPRGCPFSARPAGAGLDQVAALADDAPASLDGLDRAQQHLLRLVRVG